MRFAVCVCVTLALSGCAGRRVSPVTPAAAVPGEDRHGVTGSAAQAHGDSLESFIAKMRQLSSEARPPRPEVATVEGRDVRLREALAAAVVSPSPRSYRAVAEEYRRIGIFDKEHEYLNKALALDSKDAATHEALARLWRDAGFPHLGLSDAHRAVYYAPESAVVHNTLGTVLQALGRRELARAEYARALQLDSTAAYAWNNLCYGWILDGVPSKAVATCERALQLQPDLMAAHNNLGLAHAVAGDLRSAKAAFEAAGDRAQSLYNTGIVDLARGEYTSAARSFEASYTARPTLALAAERARQALTRARATSESGAASED